MEKSSIHKTDIAVSGSVKHTVEMGTRDEIMARLRQLPGVLGKSDAEIAEICGIAPTTWSNYKSDGASENVIRPMVALELWNALGIPMEWVYDGQTARVPDGDMRAKLAKANRDAELWLASRRPPRRGPKAYIALILAAGSFLLATAGRDGQAWERMDGHPAVTGRVLADKVDCRRMADDEPEIRDIVYKGCMLDKGYAPTSL